MLWYVSPPPLPTSPVSPLGIAVSPSGVPVTGAQKGDGGSEKGARTTLPRAQANFPLPQDHELSWLCMCACTWACAGLYCAWVAWGLWWPCSPESIAGEPETT